MNEQNCGKSDAVQSPTEGSILWDFNLTFLPVDSNEIFKSTLTTFLVEKYYLEQSQIRVATSQYIFKSMNWYANGKTGNMIFLK